MSSRVQVANDFEESLRISHEGHQSRMWTAIPGIITKVNLSAMTCEVQPAIQGVITNPDESETAVNLPVLADVPICFPSAGGFILTLPLSVGNEVLVIFSSRCIDAWWQLGGVQPPLEYRMHDLSDGFAIPGPRSTPNTVTGISSNSAQLRNDSGSVMLEITSSGVNIKGALINITGNVVVTGEVTANGIPLSAHLHPQTGGANTGAPIP